MPSVAGCVRDLLLNGEQLPMSDAQTDKFVVTVTEPQTVVRGCDSCAVDFCSVDATCSVAGKSWVIQTGNSSPVMASD